MISQKDKEIAQWALDFALKAGCSAGRVSIVVANNNSFEYRNTQLDRLHQSSENKLYIELFVDGRYGALSTNRLDKKELEHFIQNGIASTRFLAPDLCRQLPKEERYYKKNDADNLNLFDDTFSAHSIEDKIDLIKSAVEEVWGAEEKVVSVTASYDDGCGAEYMIASNGFEAEDTDTAFSLSAEVSLKTNSDARPEAFWYSSVPFWNDLQKTGIAKTALNRALSKLGQQKIKSGIYPVILDNTVSSRLFSPLIAAMYGTAIQQKNTFLLDKLGKKIVSDKITVYDTPHLQSTFGSRWYDGEGVATYNQKIIENGVLNTYFIDTYNGLKLGVDPSIAAPSVLTIEMGDKDLEGLMLLMQNGILITGFNGGNTNNTTGDFSFGIEGFLVEKGIATIPISEMNITGNILDLWNNIIAIGNDPFSKQSSRQVPSLLFDKVSCSGL